MHKERVLSQVQPAKTDASCGHSRARLPPPHLPSAVQVSQGPHRQKGASTYAGLGDCEACSLRLAVAPLQAGSYVPGDERGCHGVSSILGSLPELVSSTEWRCMHVELALQQGALSLPP
jgi:hypothetical protein